MCWWGANVRAEHGVFVGPRGEAEGSWVGGRPVMVGSRVKACAHQVYEYVADDLVGEPIQRAEHRGLLLQLAPEPRVHYHLEPISWAVGRGGLEGRRDLRARVRGP